MKAYGTYDTTSSPRRPTPEIVATLVQDHSDRVPTPPPSPAPGRARLVRFGWEHRVRDDPAVTAETQGVLFTLATFTDPDGTVTVGVERLARAAKKGTRAVERALRAGRQQGYLVQVERGHHIHGRSSKVSTHRLALPGVQAQPVTSVGLSLVPAGQPEDPPW